jgi:hypothetical protein
VGVTKTLEDKLKQYTDGSMELPDSMRGDTVLMQRAVDKERRKARQKDRHKTGWRKDAKEVGKARFCREFSLVS